MRGAEPARPLRADAARNRARVLEAPTRPSPPRVVGADRRDRPACRRRRRDGLSAFPDQRRPVRAVIEDQISASSTRDVQLLAAGKPG